MNLLLINPPNSGKSIPEEQYGIDTVKAIFQGEPLGLEVLASAAGPSHDVRIADLKADPGALDKELQSFKPDLAGITAMTCEANTALKLARRVKDLGVKTVVVGGVHATYDPETFNRPEVDYVAVGLGGSTFKGLVEALDQGREPSLPRLCRVRPGHEMAFTQAPYTPLDLMEDAPPRYDLVKKHREQYKLEALNMQVGFAVTAFGCTHACAFCCIPRTTQGRYLTRSINAVMRDLGMLKTPFIRLLDANTFGDLEQARNLCRAVKASGLKKRFLVDIRADTVAGNPDLIKEWREAGLAAAVVGFEETDDARLKAWAKGGSAEINRSAISVLKSLGILVVADYIVSPDYTEKDFEALEREITASGVDLPVPAILTPIPGTALWQKTKDRIKIADLDYYTFTNSVLPTALPEKKFYELYAGMVKRLHQKIKH
jgi:radical SAM superfamily enzyme YgiQ (UPF0313 family)